MKKIIKLFLLFILAFSLVSCNQKTDGESKESTSLESETIIENIVFTDSTGREIEIPANIERIAPSGPLAQIVLYTICPDKMVGLANEFSESQKKYVDEKYSKLPVFGNFYADTLNLETVMKEKPEVIVDIGVSKSSAKEDLDTIQDKTGIPTIFIEMEIENMADTYKTLGELTGEKEQAGKLVSYIDKSFSDIKEKSASIDEDKRASIYYAVDEGLTAMIAGTAHTEAIDLAAGKNVAEIESNVRGGGAEISMEQLMLWDPDYVFFIADGSYDSVGTKEEWQELRAIKENNYFEIPAEPYEWLGRPPAVNRLIGIKWLGNLLYPEVFDYDMVKETQDFYELFYHYKISEDEVKELLSKSSFK